MTQVLVLIAAISMSATVQEQRSFSVPAPVAAVYKFIATNQNTVAAAGRWTVLERNGDQVRICRRAPGKLLDITVREQWQVSGDTAVYVADLVRCHSGGIVAEQMRATLTNVGGRTAITVAISAQIVGISQGIADRGVEQSVRGIQRMIESQFGR